MSPDQDRDLRAARDRVARLRDSAATGYVGAASAVSLAKELAELASMLGADGEYSEAAANAAEALALASTSQALVTVQRLPEEPPGDAVASPDVSGSAGPDELSPRRLPLTRLRGCLLPQPSRSMSVAKVRRRMCGGDIVDTQRSSPTSTPRHHRPLSDR
ncbi:hypothetical protein [Krasilnikovia sp. M28-CT-15]|uniref:hypothetical protein n=1 Tax=Krasilnikovia sp. M28-CT-15 TaxID=3373540 RepID=UPI0038763CD4